MRAYTIMEMVFDLLRGDAELATVAGATPQVFYVMAPPDQSFPYMTTRLQLDPVAPWGIKQGFLEINLWDQRANAERLDAMGVRIIEILERKFYVEVEGWTGVRIWLEGEQDMMEDDDRIWRRMIRLGVRAVATSEIEAVVDRATGGG